MLGGRIDVRLRAGAVLLLVEVVRQLVADVNKMLGELADQRTVVHLGAFHRRDQLGAGGRHLGYVLGLLDVHQRNGRREAGGLLQLVARFETGRVLELLERREIQTQDAGNSRERRHVRCKQRNSLCLVGLHYKELRFYFELLPKWQPAQVNTRLKSCQHNKEIVLYPKRVGGTTNLKVQVWAGCFARAADSADSRTFSNTSTS